MKKANLFDEKVKRLCDVAQVKIPDRVPVTALVETYALSSAHRNTKKFSEAHNSIRKNIQRCIL